MRKAILMSCVVAAMMASCSSDEELSNLGEKFNGNVTLTAEPYTFDDVDTRTTLSNTGSKIAFAWDDDEAIGIFPIAPTTNIQAKQVLKSGSGNGTTSSFDGAGWALMYGNTYAAYYPFQQKEYEDYTKIPIDMTGQTQNGDNSLAHIGAGYDYMYATTSVPTKGNVNFDFKHVTSILVLELTMPDEAAWKSVTLASKDESKVFTTSAIMDVATGTVTSTATSSEVTLSLNNISTTAANKTLTLYLAVLPTTTGELTLTAKTSANKSYTATIAGKTLVVGKAYRYVEDEFVAIQTTGTENGHAWVDLGLPSGLKWATMNVGASSVTDNGKYYAWGETKAYGEEDKTNERNYNYTGGYTKGGYTLNTYKWSNDNNVNSFSKYTTLTKRKLDPEDDAATQNWGGTWRMPSFGEMQQLRNNCIWVYVTSYKGMDVRGFIVFAAKESDYRGSFLVDISSLPEEYSLDDPHIFIPYGDYDSSLGACLNWYWTSTLSDRSSQNAMQLILQGKINKPKVYEDQMLSRRYTGCLVRAVCE